MKDFTQAKLDYKKALLTDTESKTSEVNPYEEKNKYEWLEENMNRRGLIINDVKSAENLVEDWEAFVRDKNLQNRILAFVGQHKNQTHPSADIFLDYQLLFLREKSYNNSAAEIEASVERDATFRNFRQLFQAINQNYKMIVQLLDMND